MDKSRIQTYVPLIREFSSRVVFFHSAVADRLGLHVTDLKGLHLLGEEPMTAGALGRKIGLSGPAVTALIDRLEKSGFVSRERDSPDRRQITVHANSEKLKEVRRLYDGQNARMSKLFAKYTQAEFSTIMSFLERTSSILDSEARTLRNQE